MDQRSICLFLARKGLSALEIHNELVAVLSLEKRAYSTNTKYRQQRHFPAIMSEPRDEPLLTIIDDAILDILDKQPFSSIQELAKITGIPTTTVYQYLTSSPGFVVKHLPSVPHDLTNAQKDRRVSLSNQLLRALRSIKYQDGQFIITLDKSWFYLAANHE